MLRKLMFTLALALTACDQNDRAMVSAGAENNQVDTSGGISGEDKTSNSLPYLHELPLKAATGATSNAVKLSRNAKQMLYLWEELEDFRHDPKFHALGFDNPFDYGEWRGKVRKLDGQAAKALIAEIGISPAELETLGNEYFKNRGLRSDRSDAEVAKLSAALRPVAAAHGQKRVSQDTQGCSDINAAARSLRELETGDAEASNKSLDQASCVSISAGTLVGEPTRRVGYDWLKDRGQQVYVLVHAESGDLWVPESDLKR